MRFEKWQALGNDYLVVERGALPFELTPRRVRRLCEAHTGVGSDGVLLLSEVSDPSTVARLQIFNPDGSQAELSGNGAREAVLYLHARGWTTDREFTLATPAGDVHPRIVDERTCTMGLGRASLRSPDFPSGPDDGLGVLDAEGSRFAFRHVSIGNPQCAIFVSDPDELAALDLGTIGPEIENHLMFPNRTNVSFSCALEPGKLRTRIFERGVGETLSSGTGASGAAVAHVFAGGPSPVTVGLDGGELLVEIDASLQVTLTGWAVPVFAGELSATFLEELHATE